MVKQKDLWYDHDASGRMNHVEAVACNMNSDFQEAF